MGKNIPTTKDLVDWLIDNPIKYDKRGRSKPTGVPDAAKALGYTGPPLKIREGNLTNGRENLRISLKGKSSRSDYFRALAQAKTTPDKAERAAAYSKIKQLNSKGLHGDHILSNSALANGEDFVRATRGEEGVQQMRKSYKKVGGYGHSPGNIQGLTPEENGAKEIQERTLRGNNRNKTAYLQHLENKPPVSSPEFSKWDKKRQAFADKINEYDLNLLDFAAEIEISKQRERSIKQGVSPPARYKSLLRNRPVRTTTNELGGQNLPDSDAQTEVYINDPYEYTPKGAQDLPHPAASTYLPLKGV